MLAPSSDDPAIHLMYLSIIIVVLAIPVLWLLMRCGRRSRLPKTPVPTQAEEDITEIKEDISQFDSFATIIGSMAAYRNTPRVQEQGCWAIRNITGNNVAQQKLAGDAGACEAVVAAMQAHPLGVACQKNACEALQSLTWRHAANQQRAIAAGACEAVLACTHHVLPLVCDYFVPPPRHRLPVAASPLCQCFFALSGLLDLVDV